MEGDESFRFLFSVCPCPQVQIPDRVLLCGERDAKTNLLMASLATARTELLIGQGIFVTFSQGTNCLLLGSTSFPEAA